MPPLRCRPYRATLTFVTTPTPRQLLETIYHDAIAALQPEPAVASALDAVYGPGHWPPSIHVVAIGKASHTMAAAALEWCAAKQVQVLGGLCIAHVAGGAPLGPLTMLTGNHPIPGPDSATAAEGVGTYIAERVRERDAVLVLLSGGTSALIGAPLAGLSPDEYASTTEALIGGGLSINAINRERRRLSRWARGRLGEALQARGATVEVLVISDVIGDDLASIGSGPCIPDATSDAPPIPHRIISSNRAARELVLAAAQRNGLTPVRVDEPLRGDVGYCAERIALVLRTHAMHARTGSHAHKLVCWGGEPTVTLPGPHAPPGGRMQALALALAKELHNAGADARSITILAAGTDGRDGATDAAGAVVDGRTWSAIRSVGRAPEHDLASYQSHQALSLIGALVPAFASGTNVNDLVIALVQRDED